VAGLSVSGIGSGLDINSLVTQLVAAERAPNDDRIARREIKVTTQISALGTLRGALSTFKSALETLKGSTGLEPRKATVGDDDFFSATVGTSAAPGTYDVEVVALAKAHQLASAAYPTGPSAVIGTGTLTISSGGNIFNVEIGSTNNTLAGIRDAINKSSTNTSVQATLVHEEDGSHLVITARKTGEANGIEISTTGGDGNLSALVYDADGTQNMDEKQPNQDAHIRVAGFDVYSATNTVTGAIDDVTISLKKAEEGTFVSLDIANDDAEVMNRMKAFVTAYNALYTAMAKLRTYSAETKVAGPLLGDSMLNGIEEQIRRGLTDNVSGLTGTYRSLASLGIAKQVDGTLKLDETKFKVALAADRTAVSSVFNSTDGVAVRLFERIDKHLVADGDISARDSSLKKSMEVITKDKEALDTRMASVEARYRKQFLALDSLLSRMNTTSSYLASQLASLPKPNSG
jgi:flagellar hook-associated protein 2